MKALVLGLTLVTLAATACNRPSEADCRKAVLNLQRLRGLDQKPGAPDPEAAIRACRSTGHEENVRCLIEAKSAADADRCQAGQK